MVTAGLPSVGLRMPAHPVARALLDAAEVPIAAPSANRFTELSPTTAAHVREGWADAVDLILDGGPCTVGIESTVLSLAGPHPRILRPGMITRTQIEELIGPVEVGGGAESPGQHAQHYRPAHAGGLRRRLPAKAAASALTSPTIPVHGPSASTPPARSRSAGLRLDRDRSPARYAGVGRHPRPPPSRRQRYYETRP